MLDQAIDGQRIGEIAAALGCQADVDAITLALLNQTTLGSDHYEPVRASVDHLVNHGAAWRSMVRGVVPPSVRAQALSCTSRTSPTAPADAVVAVVFAAIRDALSMPG
jgi:hypothetical protein